MTYLNSPKGLNALELHVITQLPENSQAGVIVGAGDGRLALAIKEAMKGDILIQQVESRPELQKYLSGQGDVVNTPWHFDTYEKLAKKKGGLDFIVFHNIHEYWKGDVFLLHRISRLLKPSGRILLSFYNSSTLQEIGRKLVPIEAGIHRLGSPLDRWPHMDLTSWLMYFDSIQMQTTGVWGALEPEAFKFCEAKEKKKTKWTEKKYSVEITDLGDAYIMGAPVICLSVRGRDPKAKLAPPVFSGVEANASTIQSILFPYGNLGYAQLSLLDAQVEVETWKDHEHSSDTPYLAFALSQIEDLEPFKRVLVLGAGWGRDLIILKKLKPGLEVVGVEEDANLVKLGQGLVTKEGVKNSAYNPASALPYDDGMFDVVFTFQYFSSIYEPMATHLAKEALRVSSKGVVHFEDSAGANSSLLLKSYSLADVYQKMGKGGEELPLQIGNSQSSLYLLKVKKT